MNEKIFYRTIFLPLFLSVVIFCEAQTRTTIKASVDKTRIIIGEPIMLKIEAVISPNVSAPFVRIDSIPHFEFLEKQKVDTSHVGNKTVLKQTFRITSFDSGHWVIPAFVLIKNIKTDTIPIDVAFSNFDPGRDYQDIKDILDVHVLDKKKWLWYMMGGALVVIFLVIWFLRKQKPIRPKVEILINPYDEALKRLKILEKENLSPKQFYSELIDIFRLYIFKKKGILSLQKTTDDLILQLGKIDFDKNQYAQLSQVLRVSDFVKFAKFIPSEHDTQNMLETIKASIIAIELPESKTFS